MPRLSTSIHAKRRVAHLLKRLLDYANGELETEQERVSTRWTTQSATPKLLVQAKLEDLAALIEADGSGYQSKQQIREHLRHDLRLLKEFLGILEDTRTKTQGASIWNFTLTFWHLSTAKNLAELEHHWQQCKSLKAAKGCELEPAEPSKDLVCDSTTTAIEHPQPRHNLPACSHTHFIGRADLAVTLLNYLRPENSVVRIEVTGIGGVGKTSFILEVAYCLTSPERCRNWAEPAELPVFDTVVFTSAKPQQFTQQGILPHLRKEQTLNQICRSILKTLGNSIWLEKDLADQIDHIRTSFMQQQVLLIVDNLETLAEEQEVLAFLHDLPATVKVVVTSCKRAVMDVSLHLEPLSEAEGIQFIQDQMQLKAGVLPELLSPEKSRRLYQLTGGVPAAMVYAVGQLAQGYTLPDALPRLTLAEGDYCRFYFERSIAPLVGQPAHQLLMGLSVFPKPPTREVVVQVVQPEAEIVQGFPQLHQLSLVTLQGEHYKILPLTQKYALAELQKHQEFEQPLRERWIGWYLKFCRQQGSLNWKEWYDYHELDAEWENIQAAIEWCIEQERYEDFSQFWQYVKGYTHLYGYQTERLTWMNWWIEVVQQQADLATLAQALRDQAWTFTLMGRPDHLVEADLLLQRAWTLRELINLPSQLELALEQAMLALRQGRFELAQHLLQQAKHLLSPHQSEAGEPSRNAVRIAYYEAEAFCRQGQLDRSKALYGQVLHAAQRMGWQQMEIYTLNWLAEIAIHQQDLKQAENWLEQSWPIVQQQQDKRSIALHQRSWAKLARIKGDGSKSQQWAEAAIASFTDLGMEPEAQKMQS